MPQLILTPTHQLARRVRAIAAFCALACTSVAACATAGPADPSTTASSQVGRLCASVIRLSPGEAQYEGCVASLSASQRTFAPMQAAPSASAEAPGRGRSYFYASSDEVFRREQQSCARLGLDPAGGAFSSCVADLAATLAAIDTPAG